MARHRSRSTMLVILGSAVVLVGAFAGGVDGWPDFLVVGGALVAAASVFVERRAPAATASAAAELEGVASPDDAREQFDDWKQLQLAELERRDHELNDRQRDLIVRFARYQEFLEYPVEGDGTATEVPSPPRLSDHDRQVHAVLESEAERVYEKIRCNGYTKNGKVDLDTIREEVHSLVLRVAQIYSPNSANPLLETSFEQLARSASRVCLHALVLLERLPLDVKGYNINEMYGYLRKAIESYGTYQQVVPWLKHLSRGAYVGRMAAGTNPVSLGAWWLATEVGRRGAQKLVENVVDKQAVAVLHDIVTVIGVEVANVYGPGFRQRDSAWVYGAELTELLRRFPISRESLTAALKEITVLPLRSEYDRVYLYRCVADHRAAGFRIHDSTMLGRSERDGIAEKLERFFTTHIHGTTDSEVSGWQQDVESRLDLKLEFRDSVPEKSTDAQVVSAVTSVHSFLTTVVCATHYQATAAIEQTDLLTQLPLEKRVPLLESLSVTEERFNPPDLDPSATITELFLRSLAESVVSAHSWESHIEELVLETICYFRRSRDEALTMFETACKQRISQLSSENVRVKSLGAEQLRITLQHLDRSTRLLAIYSGVSLKHANGPAELSEAVVIALGEEKPIKLLLLSGEGMLTPAWDSDSDWTLHRRKGFLIDDCELRGGKWLLEDQPAPDGIVLAGSLTGGGFEKTFACLLGRRSD